MKILALDSSSSAASVAMVEFPNSYETPVVLYRYHQTHERNNSSVFFKGLEIAIQSHGRPERIVVGLGPGSYNGLRASIAAAQGIASSCNIPLIGLPSALAFKEGAAGCWVLGDARGNQYWLASVKNHQFFEEPLLLTPSAIPEMLAEHPDFPLLAYASLEKLPVLQHQLIIKTPDAFLLSLLGKNLSAATSPLEPLYLKPAHVNQATGNRLQTTG